MKIHEHTPKDLVNKTGYWYNLLAQFQPKLSDLNFAIETLDKYGGDYQIEWRTKLNYLGKPAGKEYSIFTKGLEIEDYEIKRKKESKFIKPISYHDVRMPAKRKRRHIGEGL